MAESDDLGDIFEKVTGGETVVKEEQKEDDSDRLREEESSGLPTTEIECPECGNNRASYEMKQIRAADESETRFFTCTECGHKWREDDH